MYVFQRLKGITEAIYIQAKYNGLRYEFVFTNLIPGNTRHFTSFTGVFKYKSKRTIFKINIVLKLPNIKYFRAYNSSRLYRELKLRGAILKNGRLRLLMFEKMYSIANGVWNLSSEQVIFLQFNHIFFKVNLCITNNDYL